MKINNEILQALEAAVKDAGSIAQFSRNIGVVPSTVERWVKKKSKNINSVTWEERVKSALHRYLTNPNNNDIACSLSDTRKKVLLQMNAKNIEDLPLDQQILLEKYCLLTVNQQKQIHSLIDEMNVSNQVKQYQTTKTPSMTTERPQKTAEE